jgi:GntR family transcriptional regulator
MFQLSIDHASDRPVYQQIIDQVKREIALGRLSRNQKLPTVRLLAGQLVINPNTIAKAYRLMEQQGLIITRPGSGSYVAQLDSRLSEEVRQKYLIEQIERTVVDAVHMQISRERLFEWFQAAIDKFHTSFVKGMAQ